MYIEKRCCGEKGGFVFSEQLFPQIKAIHNLFLISIGIVGKTRTMKISGSILLMICMLSCADNAEQTREIMIVDSLSNLNTQSLKDTTVVVGLPVKIDSFIADHTVNKTNDLPAAISTINTGDTSPDALLSFAETLVGIPYVWGSTNPAVGFDCSGFITYVFSHFKIQVPRSSIDFTNVGKTVPFEQAKRGDIILFSGTNSEDTHIGHMGLVVSNNEEGLHFIHSTSGKAMSVAITKLNDQYKKRFRRISRIFSQNE